MATKRLQIQDHGIMCSSYFSGTSGVWINISLDKNTTVKEIIEQLESEINQTWENIEFSAEANEFEGDLESSIEEELKKIREENKDKMDQVHNPDLEFSFEEEFDEYTDFPVLILTIEFLED